MQIFWIFLKIPIFQKNRHYKLLVSNTTKVFKSLSTETQKILKLNVFRIGKYFTSLSSQKSTLYLLLADFNSKYQRINNEIRLINYKCYLFFLFIRNFYFPINNFYQGCIRGGGVTFWKKSQFFGGNNWKNPKFSRRRR